MRARVKKNMAMSVFKTIRLGANMALSDKVNVRIMLLFTQITIACERSVKSFVVDPLQAPGNQEWILSGSW